MTPQAPPPSPEDEDLDLDLLDYLLTLSPAQRIERHEGALELVRALRKAGTKHDGFDPRAVAAGTDETPRTATPASPGR